MRQSPMNSVERWIRRVFAPSCNDEKTWFPLVYKNPSCKSVYKSYLRFQSSMIDLEKSIMGEINHEKNK